MPQSWTDRSSSAVRFEATVAAEMFAGAGGLGLLLTMSPLGLASAVLGGSAGAIAGWLLGFHDAQFLSKALHESGQVVRNWKSPSRASTYVAIGALALAMASALAENGPLAVAALLFTGAVVGMESLLIALSFHKLLRSLGREVRVEFSGLTGYRYFLASGDATAPVSASATKL